MVLKYDILTPLNECLESVETFYSEELLLGEARYLSSELLLLALD